MTNKESIIVFRYLWITINGNLRTRLPRGRTTRNLRVTLATRAGIWKLGGEAHPPQLR